MNEDDTGIDAAGYSRTDGDAIAPVASRNGRPADGRGQDGFSIVLVALCKGVVYRDEDAAKWQLLQRHQGRVQDYVSLLGLTLQIHEDEGFAFLSNREDDDGESELPRLVTRRPLSYPVSLTLALLRRRMAEHDSFSGDERIVLEVDEVINMTRTFLPTGSNEAKIVDQISGALRRISELGFIRFLRADNSRIELKRILKAFVDAQWLAEFDRRLAEYAEYAVGGDPAGQPDPAGRRASATESEDQ